MKWFVVTEESEQWVERPETMDERTRVQHTKLRHTGPKRKRPTGKRNNA